MKNDAIEAKKPITVAVLTLNQINISHRPVKIQMKIIFNLI